MNCPHCGNPLRPGAVFCPRCGNSTQTAAPQSPAVPQPPAAPLTTPVSGMQQLPSMPQNNPPYSPGPAPVYSSPPVQPPYMPQPYGVAPQAIGQLGAAGQSSSLWGPFAGYGMRREHIAWLLQGLGQRAEDLRNKVTQQFAQRQIPDARVDLLTLTGKGIAVEQRPFYRIQRGLATVWLYVARFGEDLYISQVSYIKGQISLARVILLFAMIGFIILSGISSAAVSSNLSGAMNSVPAFLGGSSEDLNVALLASLVCCFGPLGAISQIGLIFGLIFSVYKYLTEKDFLALLRAKPNEFQEDDIISLEKAVNETVRQSADIIGIDLKLLEPGKAYQSTRRLI
ncbi:MAG: zinc-ribbon domain-containing protein [Chloroflexi bacterium]|nr:zinc-ribbon domain-containing protein [Chloroflexota bacterium]